MNARSTEHEPRTVALIGNPNTGKSTLFGALSGSRQRVGNYPGVTVEKKLGRMTHAGRRWTLDRPAGDVQPRPALARRDGRHRRPARPPGRRAAARRRALRRRRQQPRTQPLPDQPGPGTGPADGRRPDHDRRGRRPRDRGRRRPARAEPGRPRRAGPGRPQGRPRRPEGRAGRRRRPDAPASARARSPRPSATRSPGSGRRWRRSRRRSAAADGGRRPCRATWSSACCSTPAVTSRGTSWPRGGPASATS